MSLPKYIEESWEIASSLVNGNLILLMTATDLETDALHNFIKPIDNYSSIIKTFHDSHTYYIGTFGNYEIAHVQSGMGSISREGSILTTSDAVRLLKPKFVLMIGIAFGIDETKQKIGDVLVSEAIIPYNSKRVGEKETIARGITAAASKTILNRFKNLRTWEHFIDELNKSELICGNILSGEELIDNKIHRDKLLEENPTAKGGEMEGAGLLSACDGKVEWIIVKGICDFADGNKGSNKTRNQNIAVNAAISVCLEIFGSKTAFDDFGIKSFEQNEAKTGLESITIENINTVLFDIYKDAYEKYYVVRSSDKDFDRTITQYGLWVYGPTGCGKSNLILRNISISKKEFIQISLANCIGLNIDDFFKEVLFELTAKTEGISNQTFPESYKECQKEIVSLLDKHFPNKNLIVFIEEIPIESESDYKEFTEKMLSLLISKSYSTTLSSVKFFLSSINNPVKHIHIFQQKIYQQMKFVELKYWDDKDITQLIKVITKNLNISLPSGFELKLLQQSKGSPRYIKKYFRNVLAIGRLDEASFNELLKETERELNY